MASTKPQGLNFRIWKSIPSIVETRWLIDGTGHLEGVMKNIANQLSSAGRQSVSFPTDAALKNEKFRNRQLHARGTTQPRRSRTDSALLSPRYSGSLALLPVTALCRKTFL
jgi:hypothetical protein